jgi:LPS export ABC transporter protein LptC
LPALLLLLFTACENDIATVRKVTSPNEAAIETGTNVEMIYSSDAKIKGRLLTPLLEKHLDEKNPYTEFPKGLKVYFYNDSMVANSKLTANYGIRYDKSNEIIVRDNVEVINTKGEKVNTEELIWNNETQKIHSDKFVKIQTKDEIIYGDGLEANQDLTDYKIKKIRGTISLKNNPADK